MVIITRPSSDNRITLVKSENRNPVSTTKKGGVSVLELTIDNESRILFDLGQEPPNGG